MKTKTYLVALMAMALTWSSCDDSENVSGGEKSKYITVATSIDNMSRVATDADGSQTFEEGDQISVYVWMGSGNVAPEAKDLVVNNSINQLTAGKWVATPQMLWKNNDDKHYFIGIYPVTAVENLAAGTYQLDAADQEKSDLLVAVNNQGLSFNHDSQNPVQFHFSHVMAKVVVTLQYKSQWSTTPNVEKVMVQNVVPTATVNYLTKAVTPAAETIDGISIPATQANEKYASILIPQGDIQKITVVIDGKNFVYDHGTPFTFESGKVTTVNLIVGRDEIKLDDVKITEWADGETFDGEALD